MGLLDHKRTWRFEVKAEPSACIAAFNRGLTSKGAFAVMKANWEISSGTDGSGHPTATASYAGRAGLAKGLSTLSRRASEEADGAIGSKLNFCVDSFDSSSGTASCSMFLSLVNKSLGFTADARFFRTYMNAVSDALSDLDPGLRSQKD